MKIHSFLLGPIENNAFVVEGENSECVIIDAPIGVEELILFIQEKKLNPKAVLLTHGHFDHVNGLPELKKHWNCPVYIHQDDAAFLNDPQLNGSLYFGFPSISEKADFLLTDKQILPLAGLEFSVIHTPGHTQGGCCFYAEGTLFSGDTLFYLGIGRTDLPGGSNQKLIQVICEKLLILPPATVVLPGHGGTTTIEKEKKSNFFLRGKKY
jgi:glyoxylase-like metal-dependent hydrolase (beta-lactamase superfamily II)